MSTNPPQKNDMLNEWLPVAILLMIPWLRIFGVFLLVKKIGKRMNLTKKQNNLIYIAAAILLFGGVSEIFSNIKNVVIPLTAVALALVGYGAFVSNRNSKFDDYVACIGDSASYPLDRLINEMGVTEKKLRRDLKALKKRNPAFQSAYIDEGRRLIVLRPEGKPMDDTQEDIEFTDSESPDEREYRETLLEIRALNIAIDDEGVSAKIKRIEEITANIFQLASQKPEKKAELQTFMEYYLPSTLKLLRRYAILEQQSAQGENILSSKARIEGMLDQLVAGFEKQLDTLFRVDAIDITSDIKVLEKMMEMDGLKEK